MHIHHCCTRARKHLGLIYRQFYKAGANMATLKTLYIAHVHPILEYGACIWDPHLQKDIDCIERVQRLASKMCTRNWSLPYDQRLSLLDLPTLSFRRKVTKMCFLYKILNGLTTPPFPLVVNNHCYNTRSHNLSLCTSYAHNNPYLYSYLNSSIRLWNALPVHIVHAPSLNSFKTAINDFYQNSNS